MRINFGKAAAVREELRGYAASIGAQAETLRETIVALSANSGTDEIVVRLKDVLSGMDSQRLKADMLATALDEAAKTFSQGENTIILSSENGDMPKSAMPVVTDVTTSAVMDWRVL